MKHLITIGQQLRQDSEEPAISDIQIDVDELIRSKALIQGNSGAGKSGLIRVIVEQINLRVPTLIIDPESEFASLREKLDMVLVAENGELRPDVRSAGLLARKLAELGASAILDIYELKGEQKHPWVRNFLEGLMALPRKLWRPMVVVMDEAHLFAPERSFGDSDALEAVQDWQFRGRKHGLSILATPRLAALNKNVSGANNIFVGRTALDVDIKRAAKLIGKSEKDATLELRELGKREFFCFGPALNTSGMALFYVADCETSIPQPGVHKHDKAPPASSAVEAIKEKLKDIEQEAEVEIKTLNEAKAEVAKLKRENKTLKSGQQPREEDTKRIAELTTAVDEAKQKTKTETKLVEKKIVIEGTVTRLEKALARAENLRDSLQEAAGTVNSEASQIAEALSNGRKMNEATLMIQPLPPVQSLRARQTEGYRPERQLDRKPSDAAMASSNGSGNLSSLHRQILNGIALLHSIGEPEPTIAQVGAVIGKSHNAGRIRGGFNQVHEMGYAEISGNKISLTPAGSSEAIPLDIRSRADIHNLWYQRLKGNELEFLRVLIFKFPDSVRLSDLGAAIGKDINAGRIRGALNALFEKGLATLDNDAVTASSLLFPSGLS